MHPAEGPEVVFFTVQPGTIAIEVCAIVQHDHVTDQALDIFAKVVIHQELIGFDEFDFAGFLRINFL